MKLLKTRLQLVRSGIGLKECIPENSTTPTTQPFKWQCRGCPSWHRRYLLKIAKFGEGTFIMDHSHISIFTSFCAVTSKC